MSLIPEQPKASTQNLDLPLTSRPAAQVLSPSEVALAVAQLSPALAEKLQHTPVSSFEFRDPITHSRLIVSTVGDVSQPREKHFSLGGFRIVPKEDTLRPDFQPLQVAVALAVEMQEKIDFAQALGIGGERGQAYLSRGQVVGGKCVFVPGENCWPGEARDRLALNFAAQCLGWLSDNTSCVPATGQDVGHGSLRQSDSSAPHETVTSYLHKAYAGSVDVDTSRPTATGLFHLMKGFLAGLSIPLSEAKISLYGAGKIGSHLLDLLLEHGVAGIWVYDHESSAAERAGKKLIVGGKTKGSAFSGNHRKAFLSMPSDVIAFNAYRHDLDEQTANSLVSQKVRPQIICGCENILMPPDQEQAIEKLLHSHGILSAPTPLCGPWGALAALESSICALQHGAFDERDILARCATMEPIGRTIASGFRDDRQGRTARQIVAARYHH